MFLMILTVIVALSQAACNTDGIDAVNLSNLKENPTKIVREFSEIKVASDRLKKRSNNFPLKNDFKNKSLFDNNKSKEPPLEIKLLSDNQLTQEEIDDKSTLEALDIVIKYENSMFGLKDSEPIMKVWRAPFATFGQIWPHPLSVTSTNNIFTICPTSHVMLFKLTGVDNYIIQDAMRRYKKIICNKSVSFYPANWEHQESLLDNVSYGQKIFRNYFTAEHQDHDNYQYLSASLIGTVNLISVFVEHSGHQWPSLYMNESYNISINSKGIFIRAKETWGLLRALESVSQLAWRTRSGRVFINETEIIDQPRFKHRGLLLDTARHFIPKEIIFKNLEAMSMNKLNVFHWHISDDQSFPLVTDNHPEFAKYGSYDFETKTYRPVDVREILEYARLRGIRVIPEIDTPSHSLSWRKSHPEVMTRCRDQYGKWTGHYGPINMAAVATYRLLKSLFADIVNMFPDQWIHLGSDEVAPTCVNNNVAIRNWMQSVGIGSVDMLTDFYTRMLQNIITEIGQNRSKLNRGFIVWQEAYERNVQLKNNSIVQIWKGQSTSEVAAMAFQRIFVLYSACWYLDHLEYGAQWTTHYKCDPSDDFGTLRDVDGYWKDYILGGEAAMWTEFYDADNVLQRIWPLASAASERLWGPKHLNNAERAASRMEEMRCRMLTRSIPVGVASGAGDCYRSFEHSSVDFSLKESIISTSTENITKLIYQLFFNAFSGISMFFILFVFSTLSIYFRKQLRLCNKRVFIIVILILGGYTFVWIGIQQRQLVN